MNLHRPDWLIGLLHRHGVPIDSTRFDIYDEIDNSHEDIFNLPGGHNDMIWDEANNGDYSFLIGYLNDNNYDYGQPRSTINDPIEHIKKKNFILYMIK